MTRKNALIEAISLVEKAKMKREKKETLISVLTTMAEELPGVHWTESAIFDACDEFLLTHPYITMKDFQRADMPSHTTIKNRFGMTAREFRDRYYPITDVSTRSPYFDRSVEEWNERFCAEFRRIRATGQDDYNHRRNKALPTWNTMAKMNGVARWNELLELLGVRKSRERTEMTVELVWR